MDIPFLVLTLLLNIALTRACWNFLSKKFEESLLNEFKEYCDSSLRSINGRWKK